MLQQPIDEPALEDAAWRDFVARLADHLAGQWPAMPQRLGERYPAFIDLAVQQALLRGLAEVGNVARYVNLWFVWGPLFHDKPGFQWAQDILTAHAPQHERLAMHQLVQRSMVELARMPGTRIEPAALDAADTGVCLTFGPLGRCGALTRRRQGAEVPPPMPRRCCDLEAVELRLLDEASTQPGADSHSARGGALQRYEFDGAAWQRVPVPAPAPLRIVAGSPCPPLLNLLSPQTGQGAVTRLQARLRMAHVCNGDVHPALLFDGPHGRWGWVGHAAKAVSWPTLTRDQPPPPAGAGTVQAEETAPERYRLTLQTCALRDEGEALGVLQTALSVWPAEQWLLDIQRTAPTDAEATQTVLPQGRLTTPRPAISTRCRLERDGQLRQSQDLKSQFEQGLDDATAQGLARLVDAWARLPGLAAAQAEAALALLTGRAVCTWGWQVTALDGPALMRLVGELDLVAAQAALDFTGVWTLRGSTSRVHLRCSGQSALKCSLRRDSDPPDLADVLLPAATASWRWGFALEIEPQADAGLGLLQLEAPPGGALVGEAGLRPCTHGRSGWEWFARLRVQEPVTVRVRVNDPLLGGSVSTHTLLPVSTVIDWSMG